jgi:hypothetical protein
MNPTFLFLRMFVEASDMAAAELVAKSVIQLLRTHCDVLRQRIEPYWKIAANYEIALELAPKEDLHLSFHNVMGSLAEGWEVHNEWNNDAWAVWAVELKGRSLIPSVVWAHLDIVLEGAVVKDSLS